MDTVFGKGETKKVPFKIKDNRAYGLGIVDMKSSLLLIYYVMQALVKENRLDAAICIVFNSDEEISSIYSRNLLEELGKKSRYALILEPARSNGDFVATRKGVMKYHIGFNGVASHSGNKHQEGKSAIQELAHWILELHELTDYNKGTTVNVGIVEGGVSSNVVCPKASCDVDVRVTSIEEAKKIDNAIKDLKNHVSTEGVTVDIEGGLKRPPMPMNEEREELQHIVEEVGEEVGIDVHWTDAGGGSDGNIVASVGAVVVDAIGPTGGLVHNKKEYLEIDSIEPSFKLLKKLIQRLS